MEAGQEDPQQGKRSMFMNKVKAKATKMKNAFQKKDGNDDQDTNQTVQGHEVEEGDDEMVEDSEVHDSVPPSSEEAGVTGILPSFNKMNVHDEPESKPKSEEAPELYTESQDHFSSEQIPPQSTANPDYTVPLDNATKLPSNQNSYTEKLSYATSAVTGQAIAAKNVVASKLGYGGNKDQTAASESPQGGEEIGKSGTTAEYEKVPNVGSSVVSKVRGTGTGQEGGGKGQDQGVSVKENLAEKLRPGEEDKALSEVISDTLYTPKQGGEGKEGENQKPVGIVTESKEVRERLGSDDDPNREMTETESKIAGNVSSPGKGMVESVKDTVTSWWSGGGDQKQASEASPGNSHGEGERLSSSTGEEAATGLGESGVGERRLQESGN